MNSDLKNQKKNGNYLHITYFWLFRYKFMLRLWKCFMCPRGCHLLDEVWGIWGEDDDPQHYLICDACGLAVDIKLRNKD